jgi:hypothetical protein
MLVHDRSQLRRGLSGKKDEIERPLEIRDALIEGMVHSWTVFLLLLEEGDERPLSGQDVGRGRSKGHLGKPKRESRKFEMSL